MNNVHETIEKLERKAADKAVTASERESFKAKAEELRKKAKPKVTEADYRQLIEEGKKEVQQTEKSAWNLGELAAKVETGWGERKLQDYAEKIGIEHNTLMVHRAVVHAWPKEKFARANISYAVARVLMTYPDKDKADLVQKYSGGLSYRKAVDIMHRWRGAKDGDNKHDNRRAERAAKKKETHGTSAHAEDMCRIFDDFLNKFGSVYQSLRAIDFSSTWGEGVRMRKNLIKSLKSLRERIDAEIARLETGDKLH